MNKIPLDLIDITELLDELDIDYTENGKNVSDGWIGVRCPFCDDLSNHLGIRKDSGVITCWKCGETGTIIKYLAEELHSYKNAITVIKKAVPKKLKLKVKEEKEHAISVKLPEYTLDRPLLSHINYLEKRGYNPKELTEKYNLKFVGNIPESKWRNRIIVPIYYRRRLITFTSIDVLSEKSNYMHLSDKKSVVGIKEHLYGLEYAQGHDVVGIVEGLFDKFRIGDGSVTSFGTRVTEKQKKQLRQFRKLIILFDGDMAGRTGAYTLAKDMSPFMEVIIGYLPAGLDPDKLDEKDIKTIKEMLGR